MLNRIRKINRKVGILELYRLKVLHLLVVYTYVSDSVLSGKLKRKTKGCLKRTFSIYLSPPVLVITSTYFRHF